VHTFSNHVVTETETTADVGTTDITLDGTYVGTLVYSMITAEGDEAIVIYFVDGNDETHETGTTTTELEAQVVGMTTVAGTNTNELTGTTTTAVDGTD
jgi:hypothetical protein